MLLHVRVQVIPPVTAQALVLNQLHAGGVVLVWSVAGHNSLKYMYDNVALGGPYSLRSIDVQRVQSARFLHASEAQRRYGVGHMHGAIVVVTRTS